jgi:bla regulator protein BlaR1
MLYTILQIIAFQALFLLVYDLLLRKETFFNYNRAYLLTTSILAMVLPFIKLPELKRVTTQEMVIQLPEVFIGTQGPTKNDVFLAEQAGIILEQPTMPFWQIVLCTGIAIATLLFLVKLLKLYWLKQVSPSRWKDDVLIIRPIHSNAAFSFFNWIFLGEKIPKEKTDTILRHELVHYRALHTTDLLLFELLRIVFWFNPLIYILQNRMKELHEFIADERAVKQIGEAEYFQSLLHQIFDTNHLSFTNTFFKKSLIKKRVAMLQKSKSKQLNLFKYALLLPLVLGMLIYTSTEVSAQQSPENSDVVNQEGSDEALIQMYYDIILSMEKKGSSFMDIASYAGMDDKNVDQYVPTKEEYLKSIAYMRYLSDKMIERKSREGVLTDEDLDLANKMKLKSTYKEHREWLKTEEAKERWEARAKDGELRLVVDDLDNKTQAEQKQLDALKKQLNEDKNFNKLIVCEATGMSKIVLYEEEETLNEDLVIKAQREVIEVPFSVIEEVPTLPECENLATNEERKQCMNTYVNKHVAKNFRISIADSLGIKGKQRIFVQFKIDITGKVRDVKARASHNELEKEAQRVINLLPRFIPGRQKGEPVIVPFALPIVFQVNSDVKKGNTPNYNKYLDSLEQNGYAELKQLILERDRVLKVSGTRNPIVKELNKQIDSIIETEISAKDKTYLRMIRLRELQKAGFYSNNNTDSRKSDTHTILINRNNRFLINNTLGDIDDIERLLRALQKNKDYILLLKYDEATSNEVLEKVVKLIESYPFVTLKKELVSPLSTKN